MIFLLEVRFLNSGATSPPFDFPDDHLYWLRDANGQIVYDGERRLINYAHPDVQDIIVGQALAIAKCGLYDGVFFDHWNDFSSKVDDKLISDEVGVNARENIIRRIREGTRQFSDYREHQRRYHSAHWSDDERRSYGVYRAIARCSERAVNSRRTGIAGMVGKQLARTSFGYVAGRHRSERTARIARTTNGSCAPRLR